MLIPTHATERTFCCGLQRAGSIRIMNVVI